MSIFDKKKTKNEIIKRDFGLIGCIFSEVLIWIKFTQQVPLLD